MMENLLKDLKGYAFSASDEELVRKVEEAMMKLDWDAILELVKMHS